MAEFAGGRPSTSSIIVSFAKPQKEAAAGFTLLEMLIVLALLGIMAVVLSGSIYLGITARSRVTAVALDQQDYSSFHRILSVELGRAYPDWIANGRYHYVDFDGGPDHLDFLGPALDVQGQGLALYSLNVGQIDRRPAVFLQTRLSSTTPAPTLTTHFGAGLATIKFEYFGISQDGNAALWQNHWTMRNST